MDKDEIKEILNDWKYVVDNKITVYGEELNYKEIKLLLNYITNLQEENERLRKQNTEYQDEIFARDNNWYDMQD